MAALARLREAGHPQPDRPGQGARDPAPDGSAGRREPGAGRLAIKRRGAADKSPGCSPVRAVPSRAKLPAVGARFDPTPRSLPWRVRVVALALATVGAFLLWTHPAGASTQTVTFD